ncbi:MAG: Co2+/Mg2+ efflux protein ApaG [Oceanospirillales bacterium]|uniref:Protein ApaG n=1 Tax=Marinobacterium halophilum TaxID=267374 RepID=A0A2P8EYL0_9GAMM|nr:Co2+/Mg2+ efflux protein ApaG [Marinobacterium halophilum]MBR9828585.1 Co2+/Mg2+ efflux protein ApaG [Oceanospirillales bacterium]PSL14556.1 ApaG protein [Marinobacterium halophilum]
MDATDYSHNIEINVVTAYLPDQSEPDAHRFVFSYQISITNHNTESVQLLSRQWRITDGNEHVQEVEGEGVVGEKPVIEPGQTYQYTSGTVLATEVGSMQGVYHMTTTDEVTFDAPIQTFTLAQPNALH